MQEKTIQKVEILLLYSLFFVLPYYGYPSGGFQFVDIFIALLVIFGCYTKSFFLFFEKANLCQPRTLLFCLWCSYTFINLFVRLFYSPNAPFSFYIYPFYGLSIIIILYGVCENIRRNQGIEVLCGVLANALLMSLVIPVFKLSSVHFQDIWVKLSFNNIIQSVFFVLMLFSIIYYCINLVKYKPSFFSLLTKYYVVLQLSIIMLIFTMPRTSLVLIPMLFIMLYQVLYGIKANHKNFFSVLLILVLATIGCFFYKIFYFYLWTYPGFFKVNSFGVSRIVNDIDIRMFNNLIVFKRGLLSFIFGEGWIKTNIEVHNNFFSILQQAGIFSFVLYTLFHWFVLRDLIKKGWMYGLPFLTYIAISCLHFTQRSRFIWIMFASIFFFLTASKKIYQTMLMLKK